MAIRWRGCTTRGRNRHHFEYWTDVSPVTHQYEPLEMPTEFFVEMCMDRIAASRTYLGDQYHDGAPLEYLQRAGDNRWMHPVTARKLRFILTMLRDKGGGENLSVHPGGGAAGTSLC